MNVDHCLNQLGELLDLFIPEDHHRAPSWLQPPYIDDLEAMLLRLRSEGATAKQIQAYIFGAWMISRPVPLTAEKHQLEAIASFIDEWFLRQSIA